MVSTDDMTIRGEIIRMDQEHDKVWADGPGTLTQWSDRALLTDRSVDASSSPDGAGAGGAPPAAPRPRTRGGKPVGDRDLLTISWTKRMEFTGRTTDTSGRPAGRADFFGNVNAWMEDAQLKCDQKMIVFTDREVPLAQLGALSKNGSRDKGRGNEDVGDGAQEQRPVDIALIYCFGHTLGVSRKIDPDVMIVNQQQIILADNRLDYDRRTGWFYVPGPGKVYLYDRSAESSDSESGSASPGQNGGLPNGSRIPRRTGRPNLGPTAERDRAVTPTSGRSLVQASGAGPASGPVRPATAVSRRSTAPGASARPSLPSQAVTPPVTRKIPPLILSQIYFTTEMHGRFGTGQSTDTRTERTGEFFGDIQFLRAEVPSQDVAFDFDKPLPTDGFFLTSQILRVIQEPPPPGAPASTPTRSFAKAWDNVTVNKGGTSVIQSDVGTYDSLNDQLYAYGEGNHGVVIAQQEGLGQPESRTEAKAAELNVKTGAVHLINSDVVQFFDKKTGSRPAHVPPPDPNAKPKKKVKPLFKIPNSNLERRGFSGT
jgi:hypothetical protein